MKDSDANFDLDTASVLTANCKENKVRLVTIYFYLASANYFQPLIKKCANIVTQSTSTTFQDRFNGLLGF